jgi:hypothetical protein
LVQERCKLTAIDGIQVEVVGRLNDETLFGLRENQGLGHGGVVRWPATEIRD